MYLKNLTVLGFKSFADKTSLNFQPGVTAIVGPNGCGKSNVSDAVRWVLGEQSAKALRGGEMADVIFNGTDHRKPLGMAEVSLTIGGVDTEHLRAAGVELAYDEVTITRRVFRDGGSEYFINKTPCRLKDIQQLFMGTGVGRTSYSIMAQGNITQILSSKPEDRRMVFEEAAGITKYKAQKREALRKLDYTEQNLLRVSDLIREVKRQIGSLQRQAGKARRYKQIAQELQHLETQLARHEFDVLQADIQERQGCVEQLRREGEACADQVLQAENEISQLREQLAELDAAIQATQQRGQEVRSQMERHESRVQHNQERLQELESQNERALREIDESARQKEGALQELGQLRIRLEEAGAELARRQEEVRQRQQQLQSAEAELAGLQDELRSAQSGAFSAAQQLTRVRNEINLLDLQKQGNLVRLEKLSSEKIQLEEERGRLQARLQDFALQVETARADVVTQRGTVEERQARLRELHQELGEATQGLDESLRLQAECRSRLGLLEQLQTDHEGFSAGALAALRQSGSVLGSLADRIRVPNEFIAAIEAALGHHLQLVLTREPAEACRILADLAEGRKGRASLAALEWTLPATAPDSMLPPAGCRPALSVVESDPSVAPLLQRLLGSAWIAADLPSAAEAWNQHPGAWTFVTPGGEVLSREGIFTGGRGNGGGCSAASLLGRKNEILELQQRLQTLQLDIEERSRRKGALQSEQTAIQAGLQQAQTDLRAREVAIATHEGEFKALQQSARTLEQKIETVVYEIQTLSAQEQEGAEKRSALAAQAAECEARERAMQEGLARLTAELDRRRQLREEAQGVLTESKVGLASQEQACSGLRQQQAPLEARIRELEQRGAQRRQEIEALLARRSQWQAEIEESRRRVETLRHEREQINLEAAGQQGRKSACEGEVHQREESLRGVRRRLTEIQQHRGALEVELAEKRMSVQNLREKIQQKYQVLLEEVRSECITITVADEGPPKIHTLTPEEMAASGAATDWSQVAQQVAGLQKRLEEMGPVNLVAIEEYEETEQRHQFLTTQHDDLVKAKDQLMEVISRINRQTTDMFRETFARIRANFQQLFVEVFGGGKADLLLVDEGDVLESGIDIVARPPGKQLQNISLLSGGEQTMTAVALLFSIYQVKPSPFCVLDELDAPLDESNINRFIKVLQRFLDHSQFIIITHNKRTIAMADVLYGVTMQEQGVSKIVSVKFHKSEEPAGVRRAEPAPALLQEPTAEDPLNVAMAK